jgi:hypothetical protein
MKPSNFSPEMRAKALEARKLAQATGKYRTDWLDADYWAFLASKRAVRLPQWQTPPTPRKLLWCHRSLEKAPFEDVYGCSPKELIALNPTMSLRAFVGQMLERVA